MWIVKLALRRPYTFIVMAVLIVLLGGVSLSRIATDIYPEIDIPVISIVWQYQGLEPDEMEARIVSNFERALTTTVNDIEHIESQTLQGVGVIKVFFQPGAKIEAATAQVTAIAQPVIRQMPPGITPPLVIRYSASNVPVLQIGLESDSLSEAQLFDLSNTFLRTGLATVQGAQMPWPFGGKQRQVQVDLDLQKLYAFGLSPPDVVNAISAQNLILPSGTAKMGTSEYPVRLNSAPGALADLGTVPIKTVNNVVVRLNDVASVRDGYAPQQSLVHSNGRRAVLVSILKAGGASTLQVVDRIRGALPQIMTTLPKELHTHLMFDQSIFVRAAVEGVLEEAAIAALLTGLMILLFLGSWRSTVVVVISIPLSILVSIICLAALGETLNTMTLGGLALAVGILVDDATVEIENVHRNLAMKKPLLQAILDGAMQIATPAFVSTLAICIVFVPVAFLSGAVRSLFLPLGMAVVFAMMTSYLLSRTLVPTLVRYLLAPEVDRYAGGQHDAGKGPIAWVHRKVEHGFEWLRGVYGLALAWGLKHRGAVLLAFVGLVVLSLVPLPLVGEDFFPQVDAGLIKMHVRAPAGTRLEESEQIFGEVEHTIREVIPAGEIETMLDNIGTPVSGINLSLSDGTLISSADGEILIALKHGHKPTAEHLRNLRKAIKLNHPELTVFAMPGDISTQVLNFGLTAPIDVEIVGPKPSFQENVQVANQLIEELQKVPGAVDVHLRQVVDAPELKLDVDRQLAAGVGLTERDVANSLLVSLASSGQVNPSFWVNPQNGVQYNVAVQTPQRLIDSTDALRTTPVVVAGREPQLLGNVSQISRSEHQVNITHYNVMNTLDVLVNVDHSDLGSVVDKTEAVVKKLKLPRGTTVSLKGQAQSMRQSFRGLGLGILFAIMLVYLLMVVNFQSWLDPAIILSSLPGGLSGIVWMLFVSQTTFNVPALLGAIMTIGVATANSILMVTFANDQREAGHDAHDAALSAGMTRLRPVVMTALAMVIGMLPMSLGLGQGGEANAPLARAVIGGLMVATFCTLFVVPLVYSWWRKKPAQAMPEELA
ncbi:MAG: efflux RND transporter permease subunit [Myxococcaceae bacterium]